MATAPVVVVPQAADYALTVKYPFNANFEAWVFCQADVHWDADDYLRGLHIEHLQEAKAKGAFLVDAGDHNDLCNSNFDRRGSKSGARPEHREDNYLDRIVDDTVEFYDKLGLIDNWLYFGTGNHDSKMLSMHNTDITERIVREMNRMRSPELPKIHRAGYGGWIKFSFEHEAGGRQQCINCKIFHGSGGGGEVTKGAMKAQRMAAMLSNADIVITGHIHEKWEIPVIKEELNEKTGQVQLRENLHVQLGSYKKDYRTDGAPTWHMQRPGGTPKPVGGKFLRFFTCKGHRIGYETRNLDVDYRNLN